VPTAGVLFFVFLNIFRGYSLFSGWFGFLLLLATPVAAYFLLFRYAQRLLNAEYTAQMAAYRAAIIDYDIRKQQHKGLLAGYQSEAAVKNFRYELMIKKMKDLTNEPKRLRRTAQRGRSEEQFYNALSRHFGKNYIRKSMQLGDFASPYAPDFCFIDAATGMHIDIEIDEPYVADSKEPIHYRDKDTDRNAFFTQNGWLVIRFSEEQIVKYPAACCTQIEALRQFALYLAPDLPAHVPQVPHWTRAEAIKMAERGARNW
jgi:very-short-patch-repair endonuclease